MKKTILFLILILFSTHLAVAECTDGTIIKGVTGTYCRSNVKVNWLTAFAWCEAQGMHLATWQEACPGSEVGAQCINLKAKGESYAWIGTPKGTSFAYAVNLSLGYAGGGNDASRVNNYNALCLYVSE